jgi:hypothetical protein
MACTNSCRHARVQGNILGQATSQDILGSLSFQGGGRLRRWSLLCSSTDPKMISRVLVFFATFYEQRFLLREGAQRLPKLAVYLDEEYLCTKQVRRSDNR